MAEETNTNEQKKWDLKNTLALVAVIVAVFSVAIGAWQADRTLHASVKPLLGTEFIEGPNERALIIHNFGMGPAVITNITFYKDGLESSYISDFASFGRRTSWSENAYLQKDGEITLAKISSDDLKSESQEGRANYTDIQIEKIMSEWGEDVNGLKVEIDYEDTLGREQKTYQGGFSRPSP